MDMTRPKIKETHAPYRTGTGDTEKVEIGGPVRGLHNRLDGLGGQTWTLIQAMDGQRTVEEIIEQVTSRHPELTADDVREGISQLADAGHIEDAAAPWPDWMTTELADRHRGPRDFYSWLDQHPRRGGPWSYLHRLQDAQVTLIGAGGTGSYAAEALIRTGLQCLHIVEPDTVEASNLSRQTLYTEADIGKPKLGAAMARLRAIDHTAEITGDRDRITGPADILHYAARSDVVVLAADEPPRDIKVWCNRGCWLAGTPWVDAGYGGPETQVQSFVPGKGACWECLMAPYDPRLPVNLASHPEDLGERVIPRHPTVAVTAGISGLQAAWHAIALITGIPEIEPGRSDQIRLLDPSRDRTEVAVSRPGCTVCGTP